MPQTPKKLSGPDQLGGTDSSSSRLPIVPQSMTPSPRDNTNLELDLGASMGAASVTSSRPTSSTGRGFRIPMNALFVVAGLISVLSAIISGYFLFTFAIDTVEDTIISGGRSRVDAVSARITPQLAGLEQTLAELRVSTVNQLSRIGPLDTIGDVFNSTLNSSLLWNWPAKIYITDSDIDGYQFDFLFPRVTDISQVKQVYSHLFYVEPDRQGKRTFIYQATRPDGITNVWYGAKFSKDGVLRVDFKDVQWRELVNISWQFNLEEHANDGVQYSNIQPWASSIDGMPYWYLTIYQYIRVDGKYLGLSVYKNLLALETQILQGLGSASDRVGSDVYLYDPIQKVIVATTYQPESQRQFNCYRTYDEFDADTDFKCMLSDPQVSNFSTIRSLFRTIVKPAWSECCDNSSLLEGESHMVKVDGRKLFLVVKVMVNKGATKLLLIWVRDADTLLSTFQSRVATVIGISCVCIIISAIVTMLVSVLGLLRPIELLAKDMDSLAKLQGGDLESTKRETRSSIKEVYALQSHFTSMATAMHSFAVYVPRDVVKEMLLSDGGMASLGMQVRHLVVAFADVADFTTLCERFAQDPATLSQILTTFFREATQSLMRYGATIDKFIGDAIMCFWGAPLAIDEPELRAICGGLALLRLCPVISKGFAHLNVSIRMRIGIHSGQCLCGNIGSELRMNYTALGDVVNTASRMEGLNKQFKSSLMVSGQVLSGCSREDQLVRRHLGAIVAKGKSEAIDGYEVFGVLRDAVSAVLDRYAEEAEKCSRDKPLSSPTQSHSGSLKLSTSTSVIRQNFFPENAMLFLAAPMEVAQLYKHRGDSLFDPEEVLATVVEETSAYDHRFLSAIVRNDNGQEFLAASNFEESQEEFKAASLLLAGSSNLVTSPEAYGFMADLQRLTALCERGARGDLQDTVYHATDK